MELNVVNREIHVEYVQIIGISSASVFLVGDADTIQQAATFDTPAESLIISPLVPFVPRG
ncbi:putative spore germination protein GerPD [Weizmannia acidilactici]|mgnify:CR=1 FL=1|uniref:Spore germination protein GerPD n=1 Tax=Weizmannia acidilactici TaxID=2607726 RepID=A0A5J4JFH5_9BACI|nr:spore gernimation protein GerPD [Weizmannia acidilactici]GER65765.1 putative spore germination protein GerPD [Weizmannia acidilactici]GER70863.1 putative spore germination protein GerPD [Weizmannia acidilactici]GER72669.1 putative spore germination protein GerPD [Weizmannia acidilactici]